MEILGSRVLLRSSDPKQLQAFYRESLGLAVAREYPGGIVFHAGAGFIEVPAHLPPDSDGIPGSGASLWLQVRDIADAARQLAEHDVPITRAARTEPWGLIEMHVQDPDGRTLIFVEIPGDHPLRTDTRH
ncbi:VOC family protein [Williamsia sterculiae]|uniref:Glyoxalase/Bleomycin resistance protein/Dioxygenase superfamily protein n=1 Tax=Williamsia sterculiae TaxID=1344003 RepID=A0A1N7GT97_9NOCA|nr:VOC family protein [Williamsia sterculiae]SIS15811.1 Glyoxalase/Bleomycin resistance protein/Dioxygenase superfamily protein [Williamsia sterculiae]